MYSTTQIALFLGVPRANVNYYIRKGVLKAVLVDGFYRVTPKDYCAFRDDYYDSNKRFKTRGQSRKLQKEDIEIISNMLKDINDKSILFDEFYERYNHLKDEVKIVNELLEYKRSK
jgi:hypothetical protein